MTKEDYIMPNLSSNIPEQTTPSCPVSGDSLEDAFEQRLGIMADKYDRERKTQLNINHELNKEIAKLREENNRQLEGERLAHASALCAASQEAEAKLKAATKAQEEAEMQLDNFKNTWEKEKAALEALMDADIEAAKQKAEQLIVTERATVQRLRGEAAVLKQRYEDQKHAAETAERKTVGREMDIARLTAEIAGLQRDIASVRGELTSRETALEEKESTIRDMTQKERKLQSVLDALTEEHRSQASTHQALTEEAGQLKKDVEVLNAELSKSSANLVHAELNGYGAKQRETAARKEAAKYHATNEALRRQVRQIQKEIQKAAAAIQDPNALKNAVLVLYQSQAMQVPEAEEGSVKESQQHPLKRETELDQIEHLQATVTRLQQQVQEQKKMLLAEKRKAVVQNGLLTKELLRMKASSGPKN